MNFLLVLYGNEERRSQIKGNPTREQIINDFVAWVEQMRKLDKYVMGDALTANRKCLKDGKFIKDGPFVESKEFMSGFFIIRAQSMEEAVELSQGHPCFRYGGAMEIIELAGH